MEKGNNGTGTKRNKVLSLIGLFLALASIAFIFYMQWEHKAREQYNLSQRRSEILSPFYEEAGRVAGTLNKKKQQLRQLEEKSAGISFTSKEKQVIDQAKARLQNEIATLRSQQEKQVTDFEQARLRANHDVLLAVSQLALQNTSKWHSELQKGNGDALLYVPVVRLGVELEYALGKPGAFSSRLYSFNPDPDFVPAASFTADEKVILEQALSALCKLNEEDEELWKRRSNEQRTKEQAKDEEKNRQEVLRLAREATTN